MVQKWGLPILKINSTGSHTEPGLKRFPKQIWENRDVQKISVFGVSQKTVFRGSEF